LWPEPLDRAQLIGRRSALPALVSFMNPGLSIGVTETSRGKCIAAGLDLARQTIRRSADVGEDIAGVATRPGSEPVHLLVDSTGSSSAVSGRRFHRRHADLFHEHSASLPCQRPWLKAEVLWAGGEEVATSVAASNDGVPRCPAERLEPVPRRPWTKIARSLPSSR